MPVEIRATQKFLAALLLAGLAASSFAQSQTPAKPYEPTVGQAGKDVVWVPTNQRLVTKMLDMAQVTPSDFVIDLGAGDGRTVIAAAKRGAHALGIEYNPDMVELCRSNAVREGVSDKARFVKADIFESDFSQATVITMFLLPDINLRLRPKIFDLKPGTRIVSNSFTMGDWEADETTSIPDEASDDETSFRSFKTALLWIVPAKVDGMWRAEGFELSFTQNYQLVTGTLRVGGKSSEITKGRLRGKQIYFVAGESEYSGMVEADRMQGTVKNGDKTSPWSAVHSGMHSR